MLSMLVWALPEELVGFSAARCALMRWLYFLGLPRPVQVMEGGWWTGLPQLERDEQEEVPQGLPASPQVPGM